jgi:hypothetical protein
MRETEHKIHRRDEVIKKELVNVKKRDHLRDLVVDDKILI